MTIRGLFQGRVKSSDARQSKKPKSAALTNDQYGWEGTEWQAA